MTKHEIRGVEVEIPDRDDNMVTTDVIVIIRSVGSKNGAPMDDRLETYYSDVPGIVLSGMLHGAHSMDTAPWHTAHHRGSSE